MGRGREISGEEGHALHSRDVLILPIYIPEQPLQCVVERHLDLLRKAGDVNIIDSDPINEDHDDGFNSSWIDTQINSFNRESNRHIILYVNRRLINCLNQTTSVNDHADVVCARFINRFDQKRKARNERLHLLCFGDVSAFEPLPLPLSRFGDLRSAAVLESNGRSIDHVNLDGTYSLIKDLNLDSCDLIFTTEDQSEFSKHLSILLKQTKNQDPNQTTVDLNGFICDGDFPVQQNGNAYSDDGRRYSFCNGRTSGYRTNDTRSPESIINGEHMFIAPESIRDSATNMTEGFDDTNKRSCWP